MQPHAVRMVAGGGSKTEATVTIRARCSGVPGGTGDGDTADMESWVDGEYEATFEGLTGSWVLYTDTVALSGDDRVEVVHPNPECSTGTRSLYVDWQTQMRRGWLSGADGGGSVVFDEGSGTDAFDGLGVEDPDASLTAVRLQVDGALRCVAASLRLSIGLSIPRRRGHRPVSPACHSGLRRPGRRLVAAGIVGQTCQTTPVGVDDIDLVVSVAIGHKHDALSVG